MPNLTNKEIVAGFGGLLKELRGAIESNNNDATTAALDKLDAHMKVAAESANRGQAAQQEPAGQGGAGAQQQPKQATQDLSRRQGSGAGDPGGVGEAGRTSR